MPPVGLPMLTFDAPLTIRMNGEEVQLIPVPVAHTDGDTMVYLPNTNVIMTGDFYRSTGYPNIDRANGGTMNGMLAGFDAIIRLARADTKIVPGHGAIVDKTAVAAHLANTLRDWRTDALGGSRSFAQRLGRQASRRLAVALGLAVGVGVGVALLLGGGATAPGIGLGVAGLLAILLGWWGERQLWYGMLIAAVCWTAAWALATG